MATSMFESILGSVTPEMTQSVAGRLGESPTAVQHGLSNATAATLNGMARNTGDPGFVNRLMQMVGRAGGQNIAGNVASVFSAGPGGAVGDMGNRLSSLVFGSQQGQIANLVSQQSGLSSSAGSGILKMAGALVLGHLTKMNSTGSLNPATLTGTLQTEASNLSNYVPSGFLSSLGGTTRETVDRDETVRDETVARGPSYTSNVLHAETPESNVLHTEGPRMPVERSNRWIGPLIAGLIGAAIVGWVVHRLVRPAIPTAIHETAYNAGTAATNVAYNTTNGIAADVTNLGQRVNITLPNGTQLNVPSRGVEIRLLQSLQHPSTQATGNTWFNFDRLLFDSNQTTLEPQSNEQLNNIAAILKAYPAVNVRLGGYTDNTGDPNANQTLSEQRADSVMAALVQRGVDPGHLSAKGYGDEDPVADNSTPQGRQMNRRISIRVAEK